LGIKVSGILALVGMGLYMAAFGKTRISPESK
jgi:NhaP-type Na+/H+ or K+/H+ antiporter